MKTAFLLFVAFLILNLSCTPKKDQNFSLQGEITGQDSGIIVLTYFYNPSLVRDTADIVNGKFNYAGKIFEPTRASLRDGSGSELAVVYFEPGKMKISISKDKTTKFKMTGSKTQNESDLLTQMINPFFEKVRVLRIQKNLLNDSIKNIKNESGKQALEKQIEELDITWSNILKLIDSTEINYVMQNPKSFISVV
jgi:hypothetical protein